MSANTETTGGPPKGYVECFDKCGNYVPSRGTRCNRCALPLLHKAGHASSTIESLTAGFGPDWSPPIAAPAFEHQALCPVERGGSCNCVPIAAPAANVERRKGQRWRLTGDPGVSREFTLLGRTDDGTAWLTDDPEPLDEYSDGSPNNVADCCWDAGAGFTMVLLADAPPEPEKPTMLCAHCRTATEVSGPDVDAVMCSACVGAGHSLRPKKSPRAQEAPITIACAKACGRSTVNDARATSWTCKQCSAQEAPKAAPVCGNSGCKTPHQNVAQRWSPRLNDAYERVGADLEWSCEPCHLLDEKEFAGLMTFESTGKPYAGPERLPKPQLAADWAEDCLGDVR